jgi:hypothetical protein
MALKPINPTTRIVKPASKGRSGLGSVLGAAGAVAGGIVGGLTGNPVAALQGAGAGAGLGQVLGGAVDPGKAPQAAQQEFSPQVQLTASQESMRAQQLLAGIDAINRQPGLGSYTAPLTKAYIQSMTNLKQMG